MPFFPPFLVGRDPPKKTTEKTIGYQLILTSLEDQVFYMALGPDHVSGGLGGLKSW